MILFRSFILIFSLFASLNADELGIDAKIGSWSKSISGDFEYKGTKVDTEKSLSFDSNSNLYMSLSFDHFLPLIPNVRVDITKVSFTNSGIVSNDFIFDNVSFNQNSGNIKQEIILDQTDIIGYYRFLDNYIRFYLGLNLKTLNGRVTLGNSSKAISTTVPLLYSQAALDFDKVKLIAEGSYTSISSTIYDAKVYMQYESRVLPLLKTGAEIGYRKELLNLDNVDGVDSELSFGGIFANLYIRF